MMPPPSAESTPCVRSAFGLLLESIRGVFPRPLWMLRTALLPFVAERLVALGCILLAEEGLCATIGVETARRTLELAAFLPCLLAWGRVGFVGGGASAPSALEWRGLGRGLDVLLPAMLAVAAGAAAAGVLAALLLGAAADPATLVAVWSILLAAAFAGGGGARLLLAAVAAACGVGGGFAAFWRLSAPHRGRIAAAALMFLCLFLLLGQSFDALAELAGEADGVVPGIRGGVYAALTAVCGHALGRELRRLCA